MLHSLGLQLPPENTFISFIIIIAVIIVKVNHKIIDVS